MRIRFNGGYGFCNALYPRSHPQIIGTGITLYAEIPWAVTLNVSIDGGPQTQHHFEGVYGCCTDSIKPAFNVTVFDVQSLPFEDHTLDLILLNTTGFLLTPGNPSSIILFDYAAINDTAIDNKNATPYPSASQYVLISP